VHNQRRAWGNRPPDGGRQSQRFFFACHITNLQLDQLAVS
jgi:hypothetical protein